MSDREAAAASEPLMDAEGENRAVRSFLMHYGSPGLTVKQMRFNMKAAGWDGCWPEWVNEDREGGHLTKAGAQLWLRHLFAMEISSAPAPDAAIPAELFDGYSVYSALSDRDKALVSHEAVSAVLDAAVRVIRSSRALRLIAANKERTAG